MSGGRADRVDQVGGAGALGGAGRIESIEPLAVDGGFRTLVYVLVRTSEGLTGLGEASLELHDGPVVAAVRALGARLAGQPADRITHVWQQGYRDGFWRPGPVVLSALSGIEQALWDIKGQVAGLPVYELLGGAVRDRLDVYANGPRGREPAELADSARAIAAAGYTAMKLSPVPPTLPVDSVAAVRTAVERVAAVREAVGDGVRVAVDAHGRLGPAMAVQLARALEPLAPWFLEEPVPPENADELRRVADATAIPIAAGERLLTRWGFRDVLRSGALGLVQPDVSHCGGIAEARAIAAAAEVEHAGFAPHNPLSPVTTVASAHVALTTPNFVALEVVVDDVPWRDALLREPLDLDGAGMRLPDRPGLGIELDLDTCAAHPPVPVPPPAWRHADGSVADW